MVTELLFRSFVPGSVPQKNTGTVKHHFYIRKEINRFGNSQVYISVYLGTRKKIKADVEGKLSDWIESKQRFKENCQWNIDQNMILDNIFSNIIHITTTYRLQQRTLSMKKFLQEYFSAVPRIDFVSFFKYVMDNDVKHAVAYTTYKRHTAIWEKLKRWKTEILFHEIDEELIGRFRQFLITKEMNRSTTVNGNIAVIKKYIRLAEKHKIKMPIDLSNIKISKGGGTRINLTAEDVKRLRTFYFSEFINENQKIILGNFLFSCFTGLRFGDVVKIERKDVLKERVLFTPEKTLTSKNVKKSIRLTPKLQQIISHEPKLFVKKYTSEHINRELKIIAKFLGITKNISFHVGRHTFATNYLRAGGKIEKLQVLLGHSSLKETMLYVHIVEDEAQEEVLKLDDLF